MTAEAVFAKAKEVRVQVIELQPPPQTVDQPVVKTAANGCGERSIAISSNVYLCAAE